MLNKSHFITPPSLIIPKSMAFKGYLINTNGLAPATIPQNKEGHKTNKVAILANLAKDWNLDVVQITETHDHPVTTLKGLEEWVATESKPNEGRHGTATITNLPMKEVVSAIDATAAFVTWQEQEIVIVTAYFSNHEDEARATVLKVDKILSTVKGRRIILAADFNSTEGISKWDAGGILPPTKHRQKRAELISELIGKWKLKDLWTHQENPKRAEETNTGTHLTHWNADRTRGVRIDRVYANFEIEGRIEVSTHYHPSSDHKGVKFIFSSPEAKEAAPQAPPLPHRAFNLPKVVIGIKEILEAWQSTSPTSENLLKDWDMAKKKIKNLAISEWRSHSSKRGRNIRRLLRNRDRNERILVELPLSHHSRPYVRALLRVYTRALDMAMAKDAEERQEVSMSKWIRLAGKPNREYLAKPRSSRAKVANMTVDNVKDDPTGNRTDDINIILDNFVKYYGGLYAHKMVHRPTLDALIKNLDLKLTEEHMTVLQAPITPEEVTKAVVHL